MKDRKEYYRNYNKKCKFINLRFNMQDEDEKELYKMIANHAWDYGISYSKFVKACTQIYMEKYL